MDRADNRIRRRMNEQAEKRLKKVDDYVIRDAAASLKDKQRRRYGVEFAITLVRKRIELDSASYLVQISAWFDKPSI